MCASFLYIYWLVNHTRLTIRNIQWPQSQLLRARSQEKNLLTHNVYIYLSLSHHDDSFPGYGHSYTIWYCTSGSMVNMTYSDMLMCVENEKGHVCDFLLPHKCSAVRLTGSVHRRNFPGASYFNILFLKEGKTQKD